MLDFVNLHLHTIYSLNDAIIRPEELAKRVKEMGQKAVAITDHGNMAGAIKFSEACLEENIKPILGMEAYITLEDPKLYDEDKKLKIVGSATEFETRQKEIKTYHMTLLSKTKEGYKNLSHLSSLGNLYGFYRRPRIWLEDVFKHSKDIVALTGCLGGYLASNVARFIAGEKELKKDIIEYLEKCVNVFGDDFYIEVMNNGFYETIGDKTITEEEIAKELLQIGHGLGIKCVASSDAHHLLKEDKKAHDIFLCLESYYFDENNTYGKRVGDGHVKSGDEIFERLPYKELLENSIEIANKCNYSISKRDVDIPSLPGIENPEETLRQKTMDGIEKAWPNLSKEEEKKLRDQIEYELKVIHDLGFDNYFLITAESVNWAKNNGIFVAPGRGSGAASRVARALNITNIDPEKFNLIFERFLNPDRKSAPDFDIDFPSSQQANMFLHLIDVFGEANVCRVATLQTMKPKSIALRIWPALAKFDNKQQKWVEEWSKCRIEIAKMYEEDITLNIEEIFKKSEILTEALQNKEFRENYYETMLKIEGAKTTWSIHAGGVIVSKVPLLDTQPMACQRTGGNYTTIIQYDKDDAEFAGLLKIDFLGLKTLDVMVTACDIINKNRNNKLDMNDLSTFDFSDARVYKFLSTGNYREDVFQIASSGIGNYIRKLQPESIDEISHMIALYRPGPLGAKNENGKSMVDSFIDRKHGKEKIINIVPELDDILKNTYGVIVYQEQIIRIAKELCGWTAAKADYLRYAVGKKKQKLIDELKPQFIESITKNINCDIETSKRLYQQIETFSKYGFNQPHSVSYGHMTYISAYMKALYPKEYICAMIHVRSDDKARVGKYIEEAKSMNINVLPPDIDNCSEQSYPEENNNDRLGLEVVKGIDQKARSNVASLTSKYKKFESLIEFLYMYKMDFGNIPTSSLQSLAKIGFFDSLDDSGSERCNRAWISENIAWFGKRINAITKRKTLDDDSKRDAIFNLESKDMVPCSLEKEHEDELFYLGFNPSNTCPFIEKNEEMINKAKAVGAMSISNAIIVNKGENPRYKKWYIVTIPAKFFIHEKSTKKNEVFMEDGYSIVPVTTNKKNNRNTIDQIIELAESKTPVLVKGKIKMDKTKQNKMVFQVISMKDMNSFSGHQAISQFVRSKY